MLVVDIKDTDELREVCSGMYGGEKAYISCKLLGIQACQVFQ